MSGQGDKVRVTVKRLTSARIVATAAAAGRSPHAPLTPGAIIRAGHHFIQPLSRGRSRKITNIWAVPKMKGCQVMDTMQFRAHHGNLALCVAFLFLTAYLNFIVILFKMLPCATSGHQSNVMEHIYLCDGRILINVLELCGPADSGEIQPFLTANKAFLLLLLSFDHHPHPPGWKLHSHFDFIEGCSLDLVSWQHRSNV